MRVIDILNKIANGEQVPKKIQIYGKNYEWDKKMKTYVNCACKSQSLIIRDFSVLRNVKILEYENNIKNLKEELEYVNDFSDTVNILIKKVDEIIDFINNENCYKVGGEDE